MEAHPRAVAPPPTPPCAGSLSTRTRCCETRTRSRTRPAPPAPRPSVHYKGGNALKCGMILQASSYCEGAAHYGKGVCCYLARRRVSPMPLQHPLDALAARSPASVSDITWPCAARDRGGAIRAAPGASAWAAGCEAGSGCLLRWLLPKALPAFMAALPAFMAAAAAYMTASMAAAQVRIDDNWHGASALNGTRTAAVGQTAPMTA
eukprot:1348919-Rhodomonas_salina.4